MQVVHEVNVIKSDTRISSHVGHTSACSHVLSFSSALNRCEIAFFFTLSISAYLGMSALQKGKLGPNMSTHVCPSYSKIASHPKHVSSCDCQTETGGIYQKLWGPSLAQSCPIDDY
jgi:hypothetical protein